MRRVRRCSCPVCDPVSSISRCLGFLTFLSLLISAVSPLHLGCSGRIVWPRVQAAPCSCPRAPKGMCCFRCRPEGSVKVTSVKLGAGVAQLCRVLADVLAALSVTMRVACGCQL